MISVFFQLAFVLSFITLSEGVCVRDVYTSLPPLPAFPSTPYSGMSPVAYTSNHWSAGKIEFCANFISWHCFLHPWASHLFHSSSSITSITFLLIFLHFLFETIYVYLLHLFIYYSHPYLGVTLLRPPAFVTPPASTNCPHLASGLLDWYLLTFFSFFFTYIHVIFILFHC